MSQPRRQIELRPRDGGILHTLTKRVRVLTVAQIARTWWSRTKAPQRNAGRRLNDLHRMGWVECYSVMAHPELPLADPLAAWQPGFEAPDFVQLARRLRSRWTEADVSTPCVVATEQAGIQFAGKGGRFPRDSEATHDVHLAAVYLRMRRDLPTRARSWVAEADLPKGQGIKVPDALVRDGLDRTAIEFAGQYDRAKLEKFHEYCSRHGLCYEIW